MHINRAFIYGDLVFETIKVTNSKPQLPNAHYERLCKSANMLKFTFTLSFAEFESAILHAIHQSNLKEARIRFTLFRNGSGFYLPDSNNVDFHLEIFPFTQANSSLKIGLYLDNHKACTPLSNIKSGNALIYVMAAIWAKENGWEDALMINEYERVCEATSSNIFIVKNLKVYTPPLTEGCVDGVMRNKLIRDLEQAGRTVYQEKLTVTDVKEADAVYITNAINGIRMVNQFEETVFQTSLPLI